MSQQDKFNNDLDPMAVMRVASAYWNSSILHVANALDVFTSLSKEGPATAQEMAKRRGVDERGIDMILMGCVCLGFMEKKGGKFFNTPLAETFLVEGPAQSARYRFHVQGLGAALVRTRKGSTYRQAGGGEAARPRRRGDAYLYHRHAPSRYSAGLAARRGSQSRRPQEDARCRRWSGYFRSSCARSTPA